MGPDSSVRPLSDCMRERNTSYYQSSSTSIYSDFLTYAQSPQGQLTRAQAHEFHARAREHPKPRHEVLEAGVGEGAFALGFLQELQRLDKAQGTDIHSRVHYTLCDFSKPMLDKAKTRLEKEGFAHQIDTREWDASDADSLPLFGADFIRCNELFSDLPADAYMRKGEQLLQARFDDKMGLHPAPADWAELDDFERKLLFALPESYVLPFNRLARDSLFALVQNLHPHGKLDVFDYGFYRADDFSIPSEIWNQTLVREFNTQWTVDLNFLYLSAALSSEGHFARVEGQEDYVNHWLAENAGAKPHPSSGLDYDSPTPADMQEDDFFYHLEVKKHG
ncbi:Putative S-adenosyl-L-methionine-dependent methyltransferase [uncultured archaeon]|nr:Putative S-adenosyl-L-methionine-dependent methyltransferase [uncultured archaeon]